MHWGFVLLQPGRTPNRVTNTRDDKVQTTFWRPSFEQRRCLVRHPTVNQTTKAHALGTGSPSTVTIAVRIPWCLAQLERSDKERPLTSRTSFITTLPNALTASINHERIPVLLASEAEQEQWLSGTPAEAYILVRSFDAERMRIVQKGMAA